MPNGLARPKVKIADLLVSVGTPVVEQPVLDVVVTEAKFVNGDIADDKAKESAANYGTPSPNSKRP